MTRCTEKPVGTTLQSPSFKIKTLGTEDTPLMSAMLTMFGEAFDDSVTYCNAQPRRAYLEGLLAKDTFFALAALSRNRVVGGLVAYELEKFERERSEIYIYDLAVAASHRRQGIATALIQELKVIAKACGAHVIFVQADRGDDPAIALYTKMGAREDVLHFDISPDSQC